MGIRRQGDDAAVKVADALTHLAWADDLWLWTGSLEALNAMLKDVPDAALRDIGLIIRWDKCSFAKASPTLSDLTEDERAPEPLQRMELAASGTCVRLLGGRRYEPRRGATSTGASGFGEYEVVRRKSYTCFTSVSSQC